MEDAGFARFPPLSGAWFLDSFFYPFALLLPATFAMGGTLASMDRFLEHLEGDRGGVAGLRSANTFSAAGTLLVTFLMLPVLGMNKTSLSLAFVNFSVATGAMVLARGKKADERAEQNPAPFPIGMKQSYLILFITGLLGVVFEVLMVRTLSQILENTVFSFAAMLVVFLFDSAAGAAVYQKTKQSVDLKRALSLMLFSTSFFCPAAAGTGISPVHGKTPAKSRTTVETGLCDCYKLSMPP